MDCPLFDGRPRVKQSNFVSLHSTALKLQAGGSVDGASSFEIANDLEVVEYVSRFPE